MENMNSEIKSLVKALNERGILTLSEFAGMAKESQKAHVKAVIRFASAHPKVGEMTIVDLLGDARYDAIVNKMVEEANGAVKASTQAPPATKAPDAPVKAAEQNGDAAKIEQLMKLSVRRWLAANPDSSVRANEFTFKSANDAISKAKAKTAQEVYDAVSRDLESKDGYRSAVADIRDILEMRGWEIAARPKEGQANFLTDRQKRVVGNDDFVGMLHYVQYDGGTAADAADGFDFMAKPAAKAPKAAEPEKKAPAPASLDDLLGGDAPATGADPLKDLL